MEIMNYKIKINLRSKLFSAFIIYSVLSVFLFSQNSFSSVPGMFGLGSGNIGMGGAVSSYVKNEFAPFYNPSLMSKNTKSLLGFSFQGNTPLFEPIENVCVDSVSCTDNPTGAVNTQYPSSFGMAFSFMTPIFPQFPSRNFFLGLTGYAPSDKLVAISSRHPLIPTYLFYHSRLHQPYITGSISGLIFEWLSFGIGANYSMAINAKSGLVINGENSYIEFNSEIEPKFGLVAGLHASWMDKYFLGITFKESLAWDISIKIDGDINFPIGENTLASLNGDALASVFHDPRTFRIGFGYQWNKNFLINMDVEYEQWDGFKAPYLVTKFLDTQDKDLIGVSNIKIDSVELKDVWNISLGVLYNINPTLAMTFGAGYKPSPVPEQNGSTNFIDTDKTIVSIGMKYYISSIPVFEEPVWINFHIQSHFLESRKIVKLEKGTMGYPGYQVGGAVIGYGLTMTTEF